MINNSVGVKDLFVKKKEPIRVSPPEPFKLGSQTSSSKPFEAQEPKVNMASTKLGPVKDMVRQSNENSMPGSEMAKPAFGINKPIAKPVGLSGLSKAIPERAQSFGESVSEKHSVSADFFIKVDDFSEVKSGIKKMSSKIKDLTFNLERMEALKKDEELKISSLKRTVGEMKSLALELESTFSKE